MSFSPVPVVTVVEVSGASVIITDNYRYYMVFDKKAMNGAITIKELLNKIKQLSNI